MRAFLALLCVGLPYQADAQFFAHCREASTSEFIRAAQAYEEHSYRLNRKFLDTYYHQRELPEDFTATTLTDIQQFLTDLEPRRTALLFYAVSDDRTCSWLVSKDKVTAAVVPSPPFFDLAHWSRVLRSSLGVTESERLRSPRKRGISPAALPMAAASPVVPQEALHELGELLLPDEVRVALLDGHYDTVLVAPVAQIATLPLAALPIDQDRMLVDVASIVILPGLFVMRDAPPVRQVRAGSALVVGDPIAADNEWEFPPLPGAREEAATVAAFVGVDPFLGERATKSNVVNAISDNPDLAIVYFATHGIASWTNPRDASFLLLSSSRLAAAEIQNFKLTGAPLVVLSACQTGLGKEFDIGTIGMTRAWERAGASNVAMSLWNVDDTATKRLMLEFVEHALEMPADKALKVAMKRSKALDADIAKWAGFMIFGSPETVLSGPGTN